MLPDRIEYWNPQNIGYKFFTEAKRLLELERTKTSSITTLQALLLTNVIFNIYSMDKLGVMYCTQAIVIAYDLKLFEPLTHLKNKRRRRSYEFTAWCLYFWIR